MGFSQNKKEKFDFFSVPGRRNRPGSPGSVLGALGDYWDPWEITGSPGSTGRKRPSGGFFLAFSVIILIFGNALPGIPI